MKRLLLTLAVASVAIVSIKAAEPALDSLKQSYETRVQKIQDEHDANLKTLLEKYGSSLDKPGE